MASYDFKKIRTFVENWRDCKGYEKGETVPFWMALFHAFNYPNEKTVLYEKHLPSGGYIDVWLRDGDVLVEQKSKGIDLDTPEPRQGKLKTPLEQALDYVDELKPIDQPRYVVTCNFETFRIYDRNSVTRSQLASNAFEFKLTDLERHPEYLAIIADPSNARFEKEKEVSIKAGDLIGKLYDKLASRYHDPTSPESMHALNVLCVRIVFCLFCEDADLFEHDAFYNFLNGVPAPYLRSALRKLFRVLDTPISERDPYDVEDMPKFPYVNGGLFRGEVEIPNFDEDTKRFLLEDISAGVDWSEISPTIFGGIFESTLNPETRRSGGMHYTSPENIHKVIDPLFLDGLKAEYASIHNDESLSERQRKFRYRKLHKKICGLKFLDPACGSGNFLTETYLCLRQLEDSIIRETDAGQAMLVGLDDMDEQRVSLGQFYGIEINDFAVTVAEAALWISKLKANANTMMLDIEVGDFPLAEGANIVHGNALRLDWNDVLPASECSYVMGNPPFKGAHAHPPRTALQTNELKDAFGNSRGIGEADYVAAWFARAADYFRYTSRPFAFVATSSITQGQQPSLIWSYLFGRGYEVSFAYKPFLWGNEAADGAAVAVTVMGVRKRSDESKILFATDYKTGSIIGSDTCKKLNPYLVCGDDVLVSSRKVPLCSVPSIGIGNKPIDGGYYLFKYDEMQDFITREPKSAVYFHKWLGATEFINNRPRYVLWLGDLSDTEIDDMPACRERVESVRAYRLNSTSAATKKLADRPTRFHVENLPKGSSVLIPQTSSERRRYLPMGFVDDSVFCSNAVRLINGASKYHFGILQSQFHNAWMRVVTGRMKSDYQYAGEVVYNNFPWPDPTPEQRKAVEDAAQGVLDARAQYPDRSLAQLYDPDGMPLKLVYAHNNLDMAVERAYGVKFNGDEEKIVAHLFKLYAELTTTKD